MFRSTVTRCATRQRRDRALRPRIDALEERKLLSAGDLDTTFGGTGMVTTATIGKMTLATTWGVATQSDGKVVVVGGGNLPNKPDNFAIVRYNQNGTLDPTFGSGGSVLLSVPTFFGAQTEAHAVAIQSDGKIVVGGYAETYTNKQGGLYQSEWAIARLNPNGTLDTTFGGGTGIALTTWIPPNNNSNSIVEVDALAIQPDGKIIAKGGGAMATGSVVTYGTGLARYNADGSLDTSFGSAGKILNTTLVSGSPYLGDQQSMVIDTAGRIDVAGYVYQPNGTTAIGVERYLSSGTPDSTFGSGGLSTVLAPAGATSASGRTLAIQSTGQIVVGGHTVYATAPRSRTTLIRLNSDGSLDSTFGTSGFYIDSRLFGDPEIIIQPSDDKIVAVAEGWVNGAVSQQFWVTRVLADGSAYDSSFGPNGLGSTTFTSGKSPFAATLDSSGRIVITGATSTARFLA